MTQPSFKTYACKAAQHNYVRRCIDSLLQTVKLIKWKNPTYEGPQQAISTYRIYKTRQNIRLNIKT